MNGHLVASSALFSIALSALSTSSFGADPAGDNDSIEATFCAARRAKTSVDPSAVTRSIDLSEKARTAALRGDYVGAAAFYRQAYTLWGNYELCLNSETLFALGMSEYRAGDLLNASYDLASYRGSLDAEPLRAVAAEKLLPELDKHLAHVVVETKGSWWRVDGKPHRQTRLDLPSKRHEPEVATWNASWVTVLDVIPGTHEISIDWIEYRANGIQFTVTGSATVTVKAGESRAVVLTPARGAPMLTSEPKAK